MKKSIIFLLLIINIVISITVFGKEYDTSNVNENPGALKIEKATALNRQVNAIFENIEKTEGGKFNIQEISKLQNQYEIFLKILTDTKPHPLLRKKHHALIQTAKLRIRALNILLSSEDIKKAFEINREANDIFLQLFEKDPDKNKKKKIR